MLLSLAYIDDGVLAAVAPACDQVPYGARYWREFHTDSVASGSVETAHVAIDDEMLVCRLLNGEYADPQAAAQAVDEYLMNAAKVTSSVEN